MIKKILLPVFALALGLVSCERDDDKYISTCPIIHDMTFKSVVTETDRIVAGEKFVATVEQAQKGHLLYKAEYKWSDGLDEGVHKPAFTSVVYDNYSNNPSDTIVFNTPGIYQIQLIAEYEISGNPDSSVGGSTEIPGGRVKYELLSQFRYRITVTKNVRVEESYISTCPVIQDMTFKSVVTETDRIVAGEKFVATVEQAQKGHLLYKADYAWSDGRGEGTHTPVPATVVYDEQPVNPTDTIIFNTPGVHQVKLVAKYHISGNYDASVVRTEEISGGRVQYELPSWMYYRVTVTKNVRVEAAP